MGWSLTLGRIDGIKVRVHVTFILFLAWIGASFWQSGGPQAAVQGLAYIVLLFGCVVAHEFGHILTARHFGADTEDVILLPIGGVARMKRIPEAPGQELWVALAGPAVNLAIAAVLVAVLGPRAVVDAFGSGDAQWHLLPDLAAANLFLAVFNLLPAFPMDGGRVLRAALAWRMGRARGTDVAARVGHVLAFAMGVYGLTSGKPLLMLVAAFIWFGANAENASVQTHAAAERLRVGDAMLTRLAMLGAGAPLAEAVELLVHSAQVDIPVVDALGRPLGLLTRDRLARALHELGADVAVGEVMLADLPQVAAEAPLDDGLRLLEEHRVPAVLVVAQNGRLAGLLTLDSLGRMALLGRLSR